MQFSNIPVEIIEQCLTDPIHRPIVSILDPSRTCMQQVLELLYSLLGDILDHPSIRKYPHFVKQVRQLVTELLVSRFQTCLERIKELIESEERYIWTDCPTFHQQVKSQSIRNIVAAYYETVIQRLRQSIPKLIVFYLIYGSNEQIQRIGETILQYDMLSLLEEDPQVEQRRTVLESQRKEIQLIKQNMEGCH